MVCAYVRKGTPRALRTTIQYLSYSISMHVHFVYCEIIDVKDCNITQRCNKLTSL